MRHTCKIQIPVHPSESTLGHTHLAMCSVADGVWVERVRGGYCAGGLRGVE